MAWAGLGEHEKANAKDASFKSMKDDPRLIAPWRRLGERMAVERQWYEAHKDDPL